MSIRRTRVYIAGPYSQPDPYVNTREAMLVWDRLSRTGYAPFCPHWSHFQNQFLMLPYMDWIAFDLEWLRVCDVLVRLPGESSGADREVAEARRLGIHIATLEELDDIPTTTEVM